MHLHGVRIVELFQRISWLVGVRHCLFAVHSLADAAPVGVHSARWAALSRRNKACMRGGTTLWERALCRDAGPRDQARSWAVGALKLATYWRNSLVDTGDGNINTSGRWPGNHRLRCPEKVDRHKPAEPPRTMTRMDFSISAALRMRAVAKQTEGMPDEA